MGAWDLRKFFLRCRGTWSRHKGSLSSAISCVFVPFFHLETPMNLKWIFFTLYCLQIPSRNHWSSISYPWSFKWWLDLSIYMISHYKTVKTPMKLHDLGKKWITTTREKTIEYVRQTIDKDTIAKNVIWCSIITFLCLNFLRHV